MKNFKRWLLLFGCMAVMFLLCSCQKMETMKIDTQLIINSNFDGERIMQTTMPKSVLNQLFDGDVGALIDLIDKYCPPEMGCTVEETGENVSIKLVIPFASLSEYKTEVYRILVRDDNPKKDTVNPAVYYDDADTMFKSGYSIEESFRSVDMFYWIITAIKTEFPKLADEDLSGLYESGRTVLNYNGTEIETGEYINYSQMVSNSFKKVHVYADIDNNANVYNARVELTISRQDYDQLKMYHLNEKMNKIAGDDIQLSTILTNTEKTYIVSFNAQSTAAFETFMNRIFNSEDSVLEVIEEDNENEALRARKYVTLYVNSGYYIDFSKPDTEVIYSINVNGDYTLEACESESNYLESTSFDSLDNISSAAIHMSAADKVTLVLGTDVPLDQVEVYTKIYSPYKMERRIAFYLSESREALIGESLTSKVKERLNNFITFEKDSADGGMTKYVVTLSADSYEKMAALTCAFLDGNSASGYSALSGGVSDENRLKTIHMNFTDKIDFSGFLGGSNVEKGIHYTFEYPMGYRGNFVDASEYENVSEENNRLSCTTRNKTLSISSKAEKTNINGIIQMLLWYMTLAVILVLVLMNLPVIIRCIKTKHLNLEDTGLFTQKGYIIVTVFTVAAVVFVITTIRLIFKVY